jgi:hypothetical protein
MPAQDSTSYAIFVGVISGIITTAVLVALSEVFRRIVLPWYQAITYRGIIIEGEWEIRSVIPDLAAQVATLELRQQACALSGISTLVVAESPDRQSARYEAVRTFRLSGTINDRLVEISFRHRDVTRLGAGVWVLEVVGDGRRMKGFQCYYDVASERVDSFEVFAQRPGMPVPNLLQYSFPEEIIGAGSGRNSGRGKRRRKGRKKTTPAINTAEENTPTASSQAESPLTKPNPETT